MNENDIRNKLHEMVYRSRDKGDLWNKLVPFVLDLVATPRNIVITGDNNEAVKIKITREGPDDVGGVEWAEGYDKWQKERDLTKIFPIREPE